MNRSGMSLTYKALAAVIAVFLPIVFTFLNDFQQNKQHIQEQILTDLNVLADSVEGQIYLFLEMNKRRLLDFASDGLIKEHLENGATGELSRHLAEHKLQLDEHISKIIVAAPDGTVVGSTERSMVGSNLSEKSFFKGALSGITITDRTTGSANTPAIALAAPVTNGGEGPLGVIVNFVELEELNSLMNGRLAKELGALTTIGDKGESMEAYVVNRDGLMITESRFLEDSVLSTRVDTSPVNACHELGKELTGFYPDYRGVVVAGSSMCIPTLGWTLLVEIDRTEAEETVAIMGRNAFITAMVVTAILALLLMLFHRNVVAQLRKLSKAAGEISSGNYDVTLPVKSGDELGELSVSFNAMASEVKARTLELERSERTLKEAQQVAHTGSWEWDIATNDLAWSDEVYRIFGLRPRELEATYEIFLGFVHPDDRKMVKVAVDRALNVREPYSVDHRIIRPDGTTRTVREKGEVGWSDKGRPVRMIGTVQDITEQKETEYELKKLSSVIEHSVNIVFITDTDGNIEYVNPTFERVTEYEKDEVIGQTPSILASGDTPRETYDELWNTILAGKTWRATLKNKRKSGGHYWCNTVISPIMNEKGQIINFLAVQEDVTEKMASEERAEYLAHYDDLTGLVNRTMFMEALDEWIVRSGKAPAEGMLFLVDVDQFKFLNDTFGHGAGDELLRRLAEELSRGVRDIRGGSEPPAARPILARLSGDEFAVFFPRMGPEEGVGAAERLRKRVEHTRLLDSPSSTTVSIGLVRYPEHGTDVKSLMTRADAAMYRAKDLGRNRCHLYRPEDRDIEEMHSRLKWKNRILKALKEDRFEPWFQPILDLSDDRVHHYEALARMRDEQGKVLLPGSFVEVAERFGIIGALDREIIHKTMTIQSALKAQGKEVSFSMNLSGKDLGDEGLLKYLKEQITSTGADPEKLVFEITETAAIEELERAKAFMKELQNMGCKFSIDDFGVGFTSFTYLKEMKVDFIKIDGAFIKKLDENPNDQLFVRAMTDVATGLGIKTVAEFVENQTTLDLLKEMGVDFAQGYHIGKPSPAMNFSAAATTKNAG